MGIQNTRDQIGWGPFAQADHIFGDPLSIRNELVGDYLSRGANFMGTVCPGGQKVGDRKSGDEMGSRPNTSQPSPTVPSALNSL